MAHSTPLNTPTNRFGTAIEAGIPTIDTASVELVTKSRARLIKERNTALRDASETPEEKARREIFGLCRKEECKRIREYAKDYWRIFPLMGNGDRMYSITTQLVPRLRDAFLRRENTRGVEWVGEKLGIKINPDYVEGYDFKIWLEPIALTDIQTDEMHTRTKLEKGHIVLKFWRWDIQSELEKDKPDKPADLSSLVDAYLMATKSDASPNFKAFRNANNFGKITFVTKSPQSSKRRRAGNEFEGSEPHNGGKPHSRCPRQ